MKKNVLFLKPGDVLLPGKETIISVRGAVAGSVCVEMNVPGRIRPVQWRVDTRHQFEIEDRAP